MPHDALLSLLFPAWQLAIAGCVLAVVVLSARPLARRGASRMNRAMIVVGGTALALATVGLLFANR